MAAAGALGSAPALLTPSCLRLCFVTRTQALELEPLEAALLKEAGEGSEGTADPSPILRPSILSGAFVRVRFDDAYRLDRIASTQLMAGGRVAARLQVTGRCVALTALSRGSLLEDDAAAWQQQDAWQRELAELQGAVAEEPPTCWEIAAACCRLSKAWQWAQQPPTFAAALQQGLPSLVAQLEVAAAVQAVLGCVEPDVPATACEQPSAAAAAEQFLAAVAAQPVHPTAASEFATAAVHAVPTPAWPVPLAAPLSAAPVAALGGAAAAAAAAAGGSSRWESVGGSGQWQASPEQQYQRIVTIVPDDMEQQRQKRGWEERGSSPAKRPRTEPVPAPQHAADRLLNSSLSELKRRRIEEDVPPGSSREALLLKAVERSCGPGQERQGGELGNALRSLDSKWKERLGGHSITDLLLAMSERGLVRTETRKDPNSTGSGRNVFYSRAAARPPPPAVRPQDPGPHRPPPAAKQAASQRLAQDVPRGSRREALLVKAVAELDSRKIERGQLLSPANLGEILNSRDRDWKSRLGGHKLNDLMWELHRRGLVRAEERTSISGQRNLFFTNLRC